MILRRFPNSKADFSAFHRENVVVRAKADDISYSEHTAPLSIKSCWQGKEIYDLNGLPMAVEKDKLLVINNDEKYASYILSNEETESFCVFFQDGIELEALAVLERPINNLLDDPLGRQNIFSPIFRHLRGPESSIFPLLRNLRQTIGEGQNSQLWVDERCHELIEVLLREQIQTLKEIEKIPMIRPGTRFELYKRLNVARDYIQSCYDEPIKLKKLSQIACLSPHHFLRLFKSVFHQTPHQYLTRVRLQKALQMLKENKSSITEICFEVGFENPSSFSRLFKSRFNRSPSEFRHKTRS
jgi:AraC family transcriptional regulator